MKHLQRFILQWLRDPTEINGTDLYKTRPDGISGIKKREYLKEKINELPRNSKNKNIRDI
jgi:hypothetical protein